MMDRFNSIYFIIEYIWSRYNLYVVEKAGQCIIINWHNNIFVMTKYFKSTFKNIYLLKQ